MRERYQPSEIESKWQQYWATHHTFATSQDPNKPKSYILDMFPYPSGAGLHVGHPEGYTATDIVARYKRARGYAVLHPMGWDAFGLPAEQYAIQTGTHPALTTAANVRTFRRQIQALGLSYDWDREIDTTDPAYVRWTQWIFLKLFHRGLAYQSEVSVNWCPALGTVLANEEVKDGVSERGAHPVVRMPLRQWMLKITAYADRLLNDLQLADWPEGTKRMQEEWIGRSVGAEISFEVLAPDSNGSNNPNDRARDDGVIHVFTTRPDTLFGATFMVLAPEHPWVPAITTAEQQTAVEQYRAQAAARSELDRRAAKDKTGVFTGAYAIHPITRAHLPIWVADYVLWGYGTGAIMAVPAHDERDFAFASKFELPIVQVVREAGAACDNTPLREPLSSEGVLMNSGAFDELSTEAAKVAITEHLEAHAKGKARVEYKLRDWVFSRQRYWGEPIPIYFPVEMTDAQGDPRRGDAHVIRYDQPIAVDESELPLRLPELADFSPGQDPSGPLARAADWRFFQKEGKWYARETNTMPQWAGSCWYYLRFMDPHNDQAPWSMEAARRWLPVDLYIGGAEHAVLHLLYSRFWHKVLYDEGLVPCIEPFAKLVHQGMILGEVEFTGYQTEQGQWVSRHEVDEDLGQHKHTKRPVARVRLTASQVDKRGSEFVLAEHPEVLIDARAHKMSKSRGNVINPDDVIATFGADSMRLFEMFLGPLEATKPWNTQGIQGVRRFLDRAYALLPKVRRDAASSRELQQHVHRAVQKVTDDIEHLRFNTAISHLMVLVNELTRLPHVPHDALVTFTQLLAPFAPHLAEEMWETLGQPPSVQHAPWPTWDEALCRDEEIEVPVQVNGKVRGRIRIAADATEPQALAAAQADSKLEPYLLGKSIRKAVWVPGKILTIVV
jgi:leucyl-tRNA synthetase